MGATAPDLNQSEAPMIASFLSLLIHILPTALSLLSKALAFAHDRRMISLGQAQTMSESAARITATLTKAKAAALVATAAAASDATDGAFDKSFQRKE